MPAETLLDRLARPGVVLASLAEKPANLPALIAGLQDHRARVRFGCAKLLLLLSERRPAEVYPCFDSLEEMLASENQIMAWTAIRIIGNLATVDRDGRIDAILPRFLKPIGGPSMITAANTMAGAVRIAAANPELSDRIVKAILRAEKGKYQTDECRNIAIGHAMTALAELFADGHAPSAVVRFARRQMENPRNGTRTKAAKLLRIVERAR